MTTPLSKHLVQEVAADYPISSGAAVRINARLDPQTASELESLVRAGDTTVTEVIKRAIHCYFEAQQDQPGRSAAQLLRSVGLIGCADGPTDLAGRYKDHLGDSLAGKHVPK